MKIFDREFSGLSQEDVLKRQQLGKTHFVESKTTKTYKEIIFNNIFTLMYFCLLWIFKWISSSSGWSGSGKPGKRTGYEPSGLLYF